MKLRYFDASEDVGLATMFSQTGKKIQNIYSTGNRKRQPKMIRDLPLDEEAEVLVLGDTAYDAKSVREACDPFF